MKRLSISILLIYISITVSYGKQLPKLTFSPHWLPQAQFAGYYVADKLGFYEEEGLDVEIKHPSTSINVAEMLKNGESEVISLFLTTAISYKNKGCDLVNICQTSQNSALLFVSKKEKNFTSLADYNGKRIGVWKSGFDEVGKALIHSNNYSVEWIPINSTVNLFLFDGIDAMTVMWYNEYHQIINSGLNEDELNTLMFSDYGYNIPEDGIYCLNNTYVERKDDLRKFIKATLKGWEYTKNHKDEALNIVLDIMRKNHVATNKSHQTWMLDKVLKLLEPGKKNIRIGELLESDYYKTQKLLIEGGYTNKSFEFNEFYKPLIYN